MNLLVTIGEYFSQNTALFVILILTAVLCVAAAVTAIVLRFLPKKKAENPVRPDDAEEAKPENGEQKDLRK